jgi:hypothetical protein
VELDTRFYGQYRLNQAFSNVVSLIIEYNVLGLCEEADLEAQMFVLAQMFIRIPKVQFSTEPAFFAKPLLCPSAFFRSVHFVSVCRFLVRWLGSSFAFFCVGLCVGKNANVLPKALAIYCSSVVVCL